MQGFKELKYVISPNEEERSLFVRQHLVREKTLEKPPERTLFVSGVPPYFSESTFKHLLKNFGNILSIFIHKTPNSKLPLNEESQYFKKEPPVEGYKVAYVVFKTELELNQVLKCSKVLKIKQNSIVSGLNKYIQEYNTSIPLTDEMEKEVNAYMINFDKECEEKKAANKRAAEDDDGWITVTKKGRRPGFTQKESGKIKSESNKRNKQLTNFYRFQVKESKMKNLAELRQKFDEDKKRIATMKAGRKFLLKL